MSGLYRKKPIPVEARQLLGSSDGQTGRDLADWCGGSVGGLFAEPKVLVPTLEGDLMARCGDWIVKGPRGKFWPVKGSIFAETYEDADTPPHGATDARAAVHAMFQLDEIAEHELDTRLDALIVEALIKAGVQYVDCPVCGAAQGVGRPCDTCAFKARMAAELAARGLTNPEDGA